MQKTEFRIQKERFVGREKPADPRESGNIKPEENVFELTTAPFCILSPEFCIPKKAESHNATILYLASL